MTLTFFLRPRNFGGGHSILYRGYAGEYKRKKKKKIDKQLDAMFGDDRPGFLQLMDDDYNANLKKILLVMLMEDDD
jgi:hypothetical protein